MSGAPAPAYTPVQLLNMPWSVRQNVLPKLSAPQRQAYHTAVNNQNNTYMRLSVPQWAPVPGAAGGFAQPFAAGSQIPFNVNTASNAMVEGFMVRFVGTLNPATGTSAAYAKNAGAPLNLIDNIQIVYGNVIQNFRPYILRTLAMLQGQTQPPQPSTVLVGQSVAAVSSYVNGGQAITVNTANVWDFEIFVPLNAIKKNDWRGCLPGMGGETQLSLLLQCATSIQVGVDPEYNILSAVSGTGHSVAVAGNFFVIAKYRDGTSHRSRAAFRMDVAGEVSVHVLRDLTLGSITAGSLMSGTIGVKSPAVWWVLLTLIDGQSSTVFSTYANTAILQESADAVGNDRLWGLGTGTNLSQFEYPFMLRRILNQDIDQGVWPIIAGPIMNVVDSDNLDGVDYLNTMPNGYPDWHYNFQFTAVGGVAGIVPRVSTHIIATGAPLRTA